MEISYERDGNEAKVYINDTFAFVILFKHYERMKKELIEIKNLYSI